MERRPLGMSGVQTTVIGLGTWPMGGEWWSGTDDAEAIRTIHRAFGRRHDVVIADKVAADHLRPHDIRAAFEGSCRRLGTDYIDVYFIHWPNIDLPLDDAIGEEWRHRIERPRMGAPMPRVRRWSAPGL